MSELRLGSALERPLTEEDWPHLEPLIKALHEMVQQKAKNREYVEAQRGKQKIIEAQDQIKRRNKTEIEQREQRALEELARKHEDERVRLGREWEGRRKAVEDEANELVSRRREKQLSEKEKHMQQVEIALPLTNSPDRELYHLRREEEECVSRSNFLEAQRLKLEIAKREYELAQKYQALRESNLRTFSEDLERRQAAEILSLEARRDQKASEVEGQRRRREKELAEKQEREAKELRWIYAEERKRYK